MSNRGIFIVKNSPYYYLRYYDKLQENLEDRRCRICTKINVTASDRAAYEQRKPGERYKIKGTPELWLKVKEWRAALVQREFEAKTGAKVKKQILLSDGFKEFKRLRSVPGIKNQLRSKTVLGYNLAVKHMIDACGDKAIYSYGEKEYIKLLNYFEDYKIRGKKIKNKTVKSPAEYTYHSMSINSRSNYTRCLAALWKFFVKKKYTDSNIIEVVKMESGSPKTIPPAELITIINYFKADVKRPERYWIVYFMLLTGCRPSTALMQMKEDIDFRNNIITMRNVKAGKAKGRNYYKFPLYNELKELLSTEMNIRQGDSGRLFSIFDINEDNYTAALAFWKTATLSLLRSKSIQRRYGLKLLRSSFISFLVNVMKMDIYKVAKLADHTDIKVTDAHYVDFRVDEIRKELDGVKLTSFLK